MNSECAKKVKLRGNTPWNPAKSEISNDTSNPLNGSNSIHSQQILRLSRKHFSKNTPEEKVANKPRSSSVTETARKRKSVRFAENLGICSDVRVFDASLPPEVPEYVLSDLIRCRSHSPSPEPTSNFIFLNNFVSCDNGNAEELTRFTKVRLYRLLAMEGVIYGLVIVANISPEKLVFIRCTSDKWCTFTDYNAEFTSVLMPMVDQFSFQIIIPDSCCGYGSQMEFAICMQCGNEQFWDNNCGSNYRVTRTISNK